MATEYLMKTNEYNINEPVIGPEIRSGSFFKSIIAATGIPKFDTGPQKWVVKIYRKFCLLNMFLNDILNSSFELGDLSLVDLAIGSKNSAFRSGPVWACVQVFHFHHIYYFRCRVPRWSQK
ncbi:hypothetical protein QG37_08075 [Candidozyma auris]|nr:hypothetical protein QG37_08075 [[Candida] auris]